MIQKILLLMLLSLSVFAKTVELTDQNTLSLNGPVDGSSMQSLMLGLKELNKIKTSEPIYLLVNSPGGSIYDGFDFIRFAKTSQRPIHTVTIFAASMGFQIVQALGNRYVTNFSTLMSHKASGGFKGEFPGQLDSRYAHVMSHLIEQDKEVVSRTKGKQTLESYAQLIQNEYWANSSKAIKDGFADEEVTVSCDKSLEGSKWQTIQTAFGDVDVEFAACPLISEPLSVRFKNRTEVNETKNPVQEFRNLFKVKNATF